MAPRFFNRILFDSPLILSFGGACITWQYVQQFHLSPMYAVESFLMVWLGYRSFQNPQAQLFPFERHAALTILFIWFYFTGFPAYTVVGGVLLIWYRWPAHFQLRAMPLAKNLAIALAWVSCTTALAIDPLTNGGSYILSDGLLVFALSMLSDARDKTLDQGQIRTLAHGLGVHAVCLVSGCAILFSIAIRPNVEWGLHLWSWFVLGVGYTCLAWQLIRTAKYRTSTIWIDSGASILPLLTMLFHSTL